MTRPRADRILHTTNIMCNLLLLLIYISKNKCYYQEYNKCKCFLYTPCFCASLLPCFLASVLTYFRASVLTCFRASVLQCFHASVVLPCFCAIMLPWCFRASDYCIIWWQTATTGFVLYLPYFPGYAHYHVSTFKSPLTSS